MSWFDIDAKNLSYTKTKVDGGSQEFWHDSLGSLLLDGVGWFLLLCTFFAVLCICYKWFGLSSVAKNRLANYGGISIALLLVVALYGGYLSMLLWGVPVIQIADAMRKGEFGDSFGTLNTLFSGLAFSGVLITLLLQRKDIDDNREQVLRQQVESQFYSLLALQQAVVQGLDLHATSDKSKLVAQGRDCFKHWRAHVVERYADTYPIFLKKDLSESERVLVASKGMVEKYQGDTGIYFRSLYSIFKFIDGSSHKDKMQLATTVRSFLSDYELVVLFYNCQTPQGEGFKKYVTMYALLDNLDVELLIKISHVKFFDKEAYGGNIVALAAYEEAQTPA